MHSKQEEQMPEFYGKLLPPLQGPHARLDMEPIRRIHIDKTDSLRSLEVTGSPYILDEVEFGCDNVCYGRAALLMVASFLDRHRGPDVDYKAYAMCNLPGDGWKEQLEKGVRVWVGMCMEEAPSVQQRLFRRSLMVSFQTDFMERGEEEYGGHMITLGLEVAGTDVWLYVFDYRMEEYSHNVHEGWFVLWMQSAVRDSWPYQHRLHELGVELNVRYEFVNLKGRLHYGNDFMMCMSVALRVSMYLALGGDPSRMRESEADFQNNSDHFRHHTATIVNYLYRHPLVKSKRGGALVSPEMHALVFEVTPHNCYLMLAPYKRSGVLKTCPERIAVESLRLHAEVFVHYDLERGVVPKTGPCGAVHHDKHAVRAAFEAFHGPARKEAAAQRAGAVHRRGGRLPVHELQDLG